MFTGPDDTFSRLSVLMAKGVIDEDIGNFILKTP